MNTAEQQEQSPGFNYHLLRSSLEGFGKNIVQLEHDEYQQAYQKAGKSYALESLVLASPEAESVVVSEQLLDESVDTVAARYADRESFVNDLEANGLDEFGLRQALRRELRFDSVMQKVASQAAAVNDLDVHLFYEMHHDRFESPEIRTASHILITINPDFVENTRDAALARMEQLVDKLGGRVNRFHDFAKRYSECPTAMDGGKMGEVKRGQLYPELDAMLFGLEAKQISPIVESEMGFHIMLCEKIKSGMRTPLNKAAPRIREILEARQQRNCQKAWLATLQNRYSG